jgi:hypothetical protein
MWPAVFKSTKYIEAAARDETCVETSFTERGAEVPEKSDRPSSCDENHLVKIWKLFPMMT